MNLRLALLGAGAVFMTVATAHADDTKAVVPGASKEAPWFQRFTASAGLGEGVKATSDLTSEQTITWAPSSKWGLTINLRDAEPTKTTGRDERAVGAFYHFTPSLRVGGEFSLADSPAGASSSILDDKEKSAGVKVESAFKF